MAFPDEAPGWSGYPGLPQHPSSTVTAVSLSTVDRTADGGVRATHVSDLKGAELVLIHDLMTSEQKAQLETFYDNTLATKFYAVFHGDLRTYTCVFKVPPTAVWLSSGSDGLGLWKITCRLSGVYSHTENYV